MNLNRNPARPLFQGQSVVPGLLVWLEGGNFKLSMIKFISQKKRMAPINWYSSYPFQTLLSILLALPYQSHTLHRPRSGGLVLCGVTPMSFQQIFQVFWQKCCQFCRFFHVGFFTKFYSSPLFDNGGRVDNGGRCGPPRCAIHVDKNGSGRWTRRRGLGWCHGDI